MIFLAYNPDVHNPIIKRLKEQFAYRYGKATTVADIDIFWIYAAITNNGGATTAEQENWCLEDMQDKESENG